MDWLPYLIVFAGSGLGGALRHGVNELVSHFGGTKYPFGIIVINVTGSLALGLLTGYFAFKSETSQHWKLFLTTGIIAGYTTFSTFSLDTVLIWERGELAASVAYVLISVAASVLALFFGIRTMR